MELLDDDQRRRLVEYHADADTWIRNLRSVVDAHSVRWQLRLGPTFRPGGDASWAAPAVRADHTMAVLKVGFPDPHATVAAAALLAYGGRGAARLYEHDAEDEVWLIELCEPGTMAADVPPEEADGAAAAVLPQLWQAPSADTFAAPRLTEVAKRRATVVRERADRFSCPLLHTGADLLADLSASDRYDQLLHGDFNQRNVLRSERGWLAIDPRPMIGDPAYELAVWLVTRIIEYPDPVLGVTKLAQRVEVPVARTLQWVTAQTIQLCSWLRQSADTERLLAYEQAARRLLAAA